MQVIFNLTLCYFLVFCLAALAGMVAERSGVVNLGIEGFMTMGALAYSIFCSLIVKSSIQTGTMPWIWMVLGVVVAIIVCIIFSFLHSFIVLRIKTDQVISGTVINLLAQGIALFLVYLDGVGSGGIVSASLSPKVQSDGAVYAYITIIFVLTVCIGIYFTFTKTGTRHIAAGENPNALDAAGIKVNRYRFVAICVSAALAGIAGIMFVIVIAKQSFNGTVQGLGFISLAIMIIGQWRVGLITLVSVLFSVLFAVGKQIQIPGLETGFPGALPFIMSLLVMIVASKWSSPPKASGIPFDKTLR